jgi:hypothetical protein
MIKRSILVLLACLGLTATILVAAPSANAGDDSSTATKYTTQPDITDRIYTKAEVDKLTKDNAKVKEVKANPKGVVAMAFGPVAGEPGFYIIDTAISTAQNGQQVAKLFIYYNGIRNKSRYQHYGLAYGVYYNTYVNICISYPENGICKSGTLEEDRPGGQGGNYRYYAGDVYTPNSQGQCITTIGWMDYVWRVNNTYHFQQVAAGGGPIHCG